MKNHTSTHPWLIWLIVSLFSLFQFFLQVVGGIMASHLMADFHLDNAGVGFLSSAFFYTYVIAQIPAGMILDRFNIRRVLISATLLCSVGCLCFALSHSFWQAFASRLIIGLGASFGFVSMIYTIGNIFPHRRFAIMLGLGELLGMLGTAIGEKFVPYLILAIDWRNVMLCCAAVAAIMSLAQLRWLYVKQVQHHSHLSLIENLLTNLKVIAQIKEVWLAGIYCCSLFSMVTVFAALWGVPYLENAHHFTYLQATTANSWMLFGIAIGAPSIGWIVGKYGRLKQTMLIASLFTLCLLLIAMFAQTLPIWTKMILLFTAGFSSSASLLAFTVVERSTQMNIRGISVGLCNAISLMGAIILQPLVGWLITHFSQHAGQATGSYQLALLVLPVVILIGFFAASMLPKLNIKD